VQATCTFISLCSIAAHAEKDPTAVRRSLRSVLALFDGEIELKLRAQALLVKLES